MILGEPCDERFPTASAGEGSRARRRVGAIRGLFVRKIREVGSGARLITEHTGYRMIHLDQMHHYRHLTQELDFKKNLL